MRRFEFVEGSSAKYWEAEVSGTSFVVVYGRLGAPGQRKEKSFATADLAQREMDRKVSEKLREGYKETTPGGAPPPVKRALPPREKARKASAAAVTAAADALMALEAEVGSRSWRVAIKTRAALRALNDIAGADPLAFGSVASVFEGLMNTVTAPRGARRLPVHHALSLLTRLDVCAWTRAITQWRAVDDDAPAAPALRALASLYDTLDDPELSLRVAVVLGDRTDAGGSAEAVWAKRWGALRDHVTARLQERGESLENTLGVLDAGHDPHLARRIVHMRTAA